jgi:site-specific DNA recombinase
MKRAVIYARVSSREQRERNTIEAQLHELPLMASRLGLSVVGTYVDNGVSGAALLERRQGMRGMLERLQGGDISHLLLFDLDRLSRHVSLGIRGQIYGAIQDSKAVIAEYTTGAQYDLGTFEGRMIVQTRVELAADWLEKHKQRIVLGKERAIRENRKPAGPSPYGLNYDRATGKFSVDEDRAAIVREIYSAITDGVSCGFIAETFNLRGVPTPRAAHWTSDRVWRLATSAAYRGEWTVDKAKGAVLQVPAIVEPELWDAAQRALTSPLRGQRRSTHRGVYLASGIARCTCGGRIQVHVRSGGRVGRYGYYACKAHAFPAVKAERCPIKARRVEEVDERLWAAIVRLLGEGWPQIEAGLLAEATARHGQQDEVRAELAQAEREQQRVAGVERALVARFRRGAVSEEAFDAALEDLAKDRARAEVALSQARATLGQSDLGLGALRAAVASVRDVLPTAPTPVRQALVRALIAPGALRLGEWSIEATVELSWDALSLSPALQAGSSTKRRHQPGDLAYRTAVELVA